jgi:hypothetical protein
MIFSLFKLFLSSNASISMEVCILLGWAGLPGDFSESVFQLIKWHVFDFTYSLGFQCSGLAYPVTAVESPSVWCVVITLVLIE